MILDAYWDFYRKMKDESLSHLLNVHVRSRDYSRQELKEIIEKGNWKYIRSFGSLQKLKPFSRYEDFHVVIVGRKTDFQES
jgi:hypothetical protein